MNRAQKLIKECTCDQGQSNKFAPEIDILRKVLGSKMIGSGSTIQDPAAGTVADLIGSTYNVPVVPGEDKMKHPGDGNGEQSK